MTSGIDSIKSLWEELIIETIPFDKYITWVLEQYGINPDFQNLLARFKESESPLKCFEA